VRSHFVTAKIENYNYPRECENLNCLIDDSNIKGIKYGQNPVFTTALLNMHHFL
jgi:hypothetical protein